LFVEWLEKNWRSKREYFKQTRVKAFADYEEAQQAKHRKNVQQQQRRVQQQQQQRESNKEADDSQP
jgi:predicted DNA-binding WGR domain protein